MPFPICNRRRYVAQAEFPTGCVRRQDIKRRGAVRSAAEAGINLSVLNRLWPNWPDSMFPAKASAASPSWRWTTPTTCSTDFWNLFQSVSGWSMARAMEGRLTVAQPTWVRAFGAFWNLARIIGTSR